MAHCPKCGRSVASSHEACERCGAPRPRDGYPTDPLIGRTVAGDQYRVIGRLGAGGFGVVYEVETIVGGLRRALKLLDARWVADPRARETFVDEARLLETVLHPNVARCYAAGYALDDHPYLLFERIDGQPLASLVVDGAGVPPRRAVRLAGQIATALEAAHRAGVLHRDLNPGNVLVLGAGSATEHVKVVDFGLAELLQDGVASCRPVAGTPHYMAPEQLEAGRPLDARVDLYQLGAVLHVLLTGRPPGRSSAELGPRPSLTGVPVPPALDLLVARLLAADPNRRPESAAEVSDELARIEQCLREPGRGPGDLLPALTATPSESAWIALYGYLSLQPDRQLELVRAAERLLERWPDALRSAPCSLWERTERGELPARWPLVRSLDLSGRGLDDRDVARLADNPALTSLTRLDLSRNAIGDGGLEALARSPHLGALVRLDLGDNRITPDGVARFVELARCPALRALGLANNRIGAVGAAALARWSSPLAELDLSDAGLGPDAARVIADAEPLGRLTSLRLSGNRIGPEGARALAGSCHLRALDTVELAQNGLGAEGAAALAEGEGLEHVRRLSLARNAIGKEGLKRLLTARMLARLQELDLSANGLGPAGAMVLAASPAVRRLSRLDLACDALGDAGVAALIGSGNLSGLRALGLAQNGLGAAAIALLAHGPPQLESLDLSRNPLGPGGAGALAEALSGLRVRALAVQRCELDARAIGALIDRASLEALDASSNPVGPDVAVIARGVAASRLEHLDLSDCGLGADGAARLAPSLSGLRSLALSSNDLGDEGVSVLVAHGPCLARLERLELADDALGPAAAETLAASSLARHLGVLGLAHNRLGDTGAERLASGPGWHALARLDLTGSAIGVAGRAALTSSEALAALSHLDLSANALARPVDARSLSEDTIALMEASFARVTAPGSQLADRFYQELFLRYPAIEPLFAGTDMARQKVHLMSSLVFVIDNLRNPDLVESNLRKLGERHLGYGVLPSHYHAVCSTMLAVVRETCGDAWSSDHDAAWADGLRAISEVMTDVSRGPTARPAT